MMNSNLSIQSEECVLVLFSVLCLSLAEQKCHISGQ